MSKIFNSSQISFPEKKMLILFEWIKAVRSITPLRIEKKNLNWMGLRIHILHQYLKLKKTSYVAKHMSYLHYTYVVVFADNDIVYKWKKALPIELDTQQTPHDK